MLSPAGSEAGELLTVNLKTFLVSILSPGLTDHGKYSTRTNVENHRALLTAPEKTSRATQVLRDRL